MSAIIQKSNINEKNLNDPEAPHNIAMNKAKVALMMHKDATFFITLCFSFRHVWDLTIPTACTNYSSIKYNPHFFMSLDQEERVFLMLHEVLHIAYLHGMRLESKDHKKWNWACDFVINAQLKERGFKMPKDGLFDPKFSGLAAEEIYKLIPPPPKDGGPAFAPDDLSPPGSEQKPGEGQEALKQKVEDIVIRAAMAAKMAGDKPGSIPGDIEIFLKKLLEPKLPWHRILAKYLNKYSKNDYSWKKPSRRYFPEHYLPALHSQSLMDLTFAIDTSGSVSDTDFNRFISEIHGVLKMMKPEKITLIQFDHAIKSVDRIKNVNDLKNIKFTGRGGTDVREVFEWVNKNKPQVLMVFTDGEFHHPGLECNTDLVWLIHNNTAFTYQQGKVIHYDIND